jgi:AcrR family transcriptional regulator
METRILEAARERFMRYGFSKVTMEEIASDLGISKKTLYKHYSNKEQVLQGVARIFTQQAQEAIGKIFDDPTLPFLEKLQSIMSAVAVQSSRFAPQIIGDIARNAPNVWQEVHAFREKRIKAFGNLIREGIQQGYLRQDLDEELVMKIYLGAAQNIMDPTSFAEARHTPKQALATLLAVLFEGMLTERGRTEYTSPLTRLS